MLPSNFTLPTKACHNCRKRRWKCDRSLPACHKCLSNNTDCLGYGKLFVWNHGVASRGKMMGKTFQEKHNDSAPEKTLVNFSDNSQNVQQQAWTTPPIDHNAPGEQGTADLTMYSALVDPVYQDLSPNSRYYLYHFVTRLCADIVIYDRPGQNPLRDLVPATTAYPTLLHIILAGSAHHICNISQDTIAKSSYQSERRPALLAYYQSVSRFGGPMKSSYADALIAKQQALSLMARSVASVNPGNIDILLASVLMFINYGLIESGRDKWRVHIEGARKLIELLDTPRYVQRPMSTLRLTILSDFLVFFIIGSTFTFSTTRALLPDTVDLDPILQYTETNNYLSCPGPLLRVMIESFKLGDTRQSLSDEISIEVQERIGDLLKAALHFDPAAWAHDFEPASPCENRDHRMHIAYAHRAAVCIYLARALPYTNPLINPESEHALISLTGLAHEILHHVAYFKPGDTLYKSISWPVFLAGAECDDHASRTWIMDKLDEFYHLLYWGYVPTAKKILETIWSCKDKAAEGDTVSCWIADVRELGYETLIA